MSDSSTPDTTAPDDAVSTLVMPPTVKIPTSEGLLVVYKVQCESCEQGDKPCQVDQGNSLRCVPCQKGKKKCQRGGVSVAASKRKTPGTPSSKATAARVTTPAPASKVGRPRGTTPSPGGDNGKSMMSTLNLKGITKKRKKLDTEDADDDKPKKKKKNKDGDAEETSKAAPLIKAKNHKTDTTAHDKEGPAKNVAQAITDANLANANRRTDSSKQPAAGKKDPKVKVHTLKPDAKKPSQGTEAPTVVSSNDEDSDHPSSTALASSRSQAQKKSSAAALQSKGFAVVIERKTPQKPVEPATQVAVEQVKAPNGHVGKTKDTTSKPRKEASNLSNPAALHIPSDNISKSTKAKEARKKNATAKSSASNKPAIGVGSMRVDKDAEAVVIDNEPSDEILSAISEALQQIKEFCVSSRDLLTKLQDEVQGKGSKGQDLHSLLASVVKNMDSSQGHANSVLQTHLDQRGRS